MTTHIAFLRGINVGAHNRMKMDDLREMCTSMGLQGVQTYIQSGNVVFESPETDIGVIRDDLMEAIHDAFGYDIITMVLTRDELADVVDRQPFGESSDDTTKRYATFLHEEPSDEQIQRLQFGQSSAEEFVVDGRVVFSRLHPDEMNAGRFTDVGEVLGHTATRRTWNVVERVLELASS